MYKRDDNSHGNNINVEISTPFSSGEFGEVYSDNRESWLKYKEDFSFTLLN